MKGVLERFMQGMVLIALMLAWAVSSCQQLPAPGEHKAATLTVLSEVCNTYSAALRVLTPMRREGRLSEGEVARVEAANAVADEVCLPDAAPPGDPLDAISRINAKVVELLAIREGA